MTKPHERLAPTKRPKQDIAFVFRSYQELRQQLGDIDSLGAAIIIATRDLSNTAAATSDSQGYLVERALPLGVNTRHVDFGRLEPRTVQLLLVGVFQQVEAFLTELRAEQKLFGRSLDGPREGETIMAQTLKNLPGGTLANQQRLGRERLDLLDYYRLARNGFAHVGDEDKLARAFDNVKHHRALVASEFGLAAPNPVGELTHDDYLLATRLTKYLATDICRLAGPTDASEIIKMMENGDFADNPVSVITKRRNSEAIVRRAVTGWLHTHFVYAVHDHPGVLDEIIAWSTTLPTRRERRHARRIEEGHS